MTEKNIEKTISEHINLSLNLNNLKLNEVDDDLNCILCDFKTRIPFNQDLMSHLLQTHNIIIKNCERIPYLSWYIYMKFEQINIHLNLLQYKHYCFQC